MRNVAAGNSVVISNADNKNLPCDSLCSSVAGLGANVSLFSKEYKERNGAIGSKKLDVDEILSEKKGKPARDPYASKEEVEEADFFADFDEDETRQPKASNNHKFKALANIISPKHKLGGGAGKGGGAQSPTKSQGFFSKLSKHGGEISER